MLQKGEIMYFTNSEEKAGIIQSGDFSGNSQVAQSIKPLMESNIFAMYMNQYMLELADEDFDDLGLQSVQVTANGKKAEGILKIKDQNQNSLKTLVGELNKKYLEQKAKEEAEEKQEGSQI